MSSVYDYIDLNSKIGFYYKNSFETTDPYKKYKINLEMLFSILLKEFPVVSSIEEDSKRVINELFLDTLDDVVTYTQSEEKERETNNSLDLVMDSEDDQNDQDDKDYQETEIYEKIVVLKKILNEMVVVENKQLVNTFKFFTEGSKEYIIRIGPFDTTWIKSDADKEMFLDLRIVNFGINIERNQNIDLDDTIIQSIQLRSITIDEENKLKESFPRFDYNNKREFIKTVIAVRFRIFLTEEQFNYWRLCIESIDKKNSLYYSEIDSHWMFKQIFSIISISLNLALRDSVKFLCFLVNLGTSDDSISSTEFLTILPKNNKPFWTHLNSSVTNRLLDTEKFTYNLRKICMLYSKMDNYVNKEAGILQKNKLKTQGSKDFYKIYYNLATLYDKSQRMYSFEEFVFMFSRGMESLLLSEKVELSYQFKNIITAILTKIHFDETINFDKYKESIFIDMLKDLYNLRSDFAHMNVGKSLKLSNLGKHDDKDAKFLYLEELYFRYGVFLVKILDMLDENDTESLSEKLREIVFFGRKIKNKEFMDLFKN